MKVLPHNGRPHMQIALAVLVMILALHAGRAVAQGPLMQLIPDTGQIGNCNFITGDFDFECIPLYLSYVIRIAFGFAGGFAMTEVIRGGYEYALSGMQGIGLGPDKESAKKRITHAIMGLSVTVLAYVIIDTIVAALFSGT